MHLWPRAYATATDIDPIAIDVTAENAETNGVPLGLGIGRLALTVADGTDNALVLRRARYDLIVSNSLAGPLIHTAAGGAPDPDNQNTPRWGMGCADVENAEGS